MIPMPKLRVPMPLTTLIVDDEPLAREGLRALLSTDAEISSILEARDGREAVRAIRESSPDLVFLDVQMNWRGTDAGGSVRHRPRPIRNSGL